eukprot:TRINITY_DN10404_c0_g1_i1.p1 TRINITY_DN10404_c0_g1~~TRINITY_DN10404_c0_g1_i1.p1  ORF type:complete len:149 (+),score=12.94 TRINITY_DN10404_c0_g1_i1:47-448(+)
MTDFVVAVYPGDDVVPGSVRLNVVGAEDSYDTFPKDISSVFSFAQEMVSAWCDANPTTSPPVCLVCLGDSVVCCQLTAAWAYIIVSCPDRSQLNALQVPICYVSKHFHTMPGSESFSQVDAFPSWLSLSDPQR